MDVYQQLTERLRTVIPSSRLISDPLRTLVYGTDASCYRLTPKLVVRAFSENEVAAVMRECRVLKIPYTFRAAGTSLSGQAISDSVLIQLSRTWANMDINEDGTVVRFDPLVLGGQANAALAKFQRKIGPDPASIDSATIGGIVSNNSSGMCCGNVQDTYHTLKSLRVTLSDGTVVDTGSPESRHEFALKRGDLLKELEEMARRAKANESLSARIRKKYRIKNTMGYNLHSLIDFTDGFDILTHLIIGSEGTLGFVSSATYYTVPDPPHFATGLLLFEDIRSACEACIRLSQTPVSAAELMDRLSLQTVEHKPGIPAYYRELGPDAAALLVELRGESIAELNDRETRALGILKGSGLLRPPVFSRDKNESKQYWAIRKGLIASLGAIRKTGATLIMEDVAVETDLLAESCLDLRAVMDQDGYSDGVIFGHVLQGNMHFTICPDLNQDDGIKRYQTFLGDVANLIVGKYDGSLKAEHGTGRNMASFLEQEWGTEAVGYMREIKRTFDPEYLLNPGVILNDDPLSHVKNLKRIPASDPIIEKCIECGFCERMCPSRHLTLTPRHRIVAYREISRLKETGEDAARLAEFEREFAYLGNETCAGDGMCATACPLDIDTGKFIKSLRKKQVSAMANSVASFVGRNMGAVSAVSRLALSAAAGASAVLGSNAVESVSGLMSQLTGLPQWHPWIPKAAAGLPSPKAAERQAVYFPSCTSRIFGSPQSQSEAMVELMAKAGYQAVYPDNVNQLCCGLAFASKGYEAAGETKRGELLAAIEKASQGGKLPVVFDTSPCVHRLREGKTPVPLQDVVEFTMEHLAPRLQFTKQPGLIAVHAPCSSKKMSLEQKFIDLAGLCSEKVVVPGSVPCCGFAGDRGFSNPELTASALISLKGGIPKSCSAGYSSSRTCEIGLTAHSGIPYQSIVHLVNSATAPKVNLAVEPELANQKA